MHISFENWRGREEGNGCLGEARGCLMFHIMKMSFLSFISCEWHNRKEDLLEILIFSPKIYFEKGTESYIATVYFLISLIMTIRTIRNDTVWYGTQLLTVTMITLTIMMTVTMEEKSMKYLLKFCFGKVPAIQDRPFLYDFDSLPSACQLFLSTS